MLVVESIEWADSAVPRRWVGRLATGLRLCFGVRLCFFFGQGSWSMSLGESSAGAVSTTTVCGLFCGSVSEQCIPADNCTALSVVTARAPPSSCLSLPLCPDWVVPEATLALPLPAILGANPPVTSPPTLEKSGGNNVANPSTTPFSLCFFLKIG